MAIQVKGVTLKAFQENQRRRKDEIEQRAGKSVEQLYEEKEARVRDAIALKESDRVPVSLRMTYFPSRYCGIPTAAAYYDPITWRDAVAKTVTDMDPDIFQCSSGTSSGAVNEALDPTQTRWPGGPLPDNVSHQAIDIETMKENEYDFYFSDPTGFAIRCLLPRSYNALGPLASLPPLAGRGQMFAAMTPMFTRQEWRDMAKAILKAGQEMERWRQTQGSLEADMFELGFPPNGHGGGAGGAPFDQVSDFYRGMRGAMTDMYRQPENLLRMLDQLSKEALRRVQPANPDTPGNPKRLFIALHRGAETFMSRKQFEKFYWPGLKAAMLKSIEMGFVPMPFCEGKYGDRIEYFLEMPKGKVVCHFDLSDMHRAKDVLKDHVCIMGNVPSPLLQFGKPHEVEDYCKDLIEYCGKGGGFILTNGSSTDTADPVLVKTMCEATRKFSVH